MTQEDEDLTEIVDWLTNPFNCCNSWPKQNSKKEYSCILYRERNISSTRLSEFLINM
jgi:hypothetical protein